MAEFDLRNSSDTLFAIALASLANALLIVACRRLEFSKGNQCPPGAHPTAKRNRPTSHKASETYTRDDVLCFAVSKSRGVGWPRELYRQLLQGSTLERTLFPLGSRSKSSYSAFVFRCTVTERLHQVALAGFDVQVPAWLPEELILLVGEGLFADLAH
jgi:hypothetical protein